MCPEETLDNYIWPVTNSSTTVELGCNSYQIGSVSRYCHPAGVWGDPVNNCHEVQCEDITVKKLANGCMNVRFNPYETMPFVRANVVPASSPESPLCRPAAVSFHPPAHLWHPSVFCGHQQFPVLQHRYLPARPP